MPVLFKLVAVCSRCPERCEFEAAVPHIDGRYAVEHEHPLPDGYTRKHKPFGAGSEVLCRTCTEKDNEQYVLRAKGTS
jgi:hypothetical protein